MAKTDKVNMCGADFKCMARGNEHLCKFAHMMTDNSCLHYHPSGGCYYNNAQFDLIRGVYLRWQRERREAKKGD